MSDSMDDRLFVGKVVSTFDDILVFFIEKKIDKYEVYCPCTDSNSIIDSIKLIDNKENINKKIFFITSYKPALTMKVQFQNKPYTVVSTFNSKNQFEPIMILISKKSIDIIDIPLGLLLCNKTI